MKTKLLLLLAVFMTAFGVNAQITSVAIVGTPFGGYPTGNAVDVNQLTLVAGTTDQYVLNDLNVPTNGDFKIRANGSWSNDAYIWGTSLSQGSIVTSGTLVNPGNNVGIVSGTYTLNFNTTTGVFSLTGGVPIPVVKLVGTAVPEGMLTMNTISPTTFALPLTTFLAGTAQFEIDGALNGGDAFPVGTLQSAATPLINVLGAAYSSVTLDLGSGAYTFVAAPLTQDVTLIGDGVGSWSVDTPIFSSAGSDNYFLNDLTTFAGQCKFRVNAATAGWNGSFGGAVFPSGTGVVGNDNITGVIAGNYDVKVNLATKVFSFLQTPIGIIGEAVGGWGATNEKPLTTVDGVNYTINNLETFAGACKFRRYADWPGSVGNSTFPSGTATISNDNITGVLPGFYDVTFNKLTGAFSFTPSLATTSFATAGFKVYPNPSNNVWNFTSAKEAIVSVQVIDMLGKVVVTSSTTTVDASALNAGVYFAKVTSANATATVKVVKN
jgi:starch-binding outer membrane protein SusE/F